MRFLGRTVVSPFGKQLVRWIRGRYVRHHLREDSGFYCPSPDVLVGVSLKPRTNGDTVTCYILSLLSAGDKPHMAAFGHFASFALDKGSRRAGAKARLPVGPLLRKLCTRESTGIVSSDE